MLGDPEAICFLFAGKRSTAARSFRKEVQRFKDKFVYGIENISIGYYIKYLENLQDNLSKLMDVKSLLNSTKSQMAPMRKMMFEMTALR